MARESQGPTLLEVQPIRFDQKRKDRNGRRGASNP